LNARTDSDLEPAFAAFSQQHLGAVLIGNSTLYNRRMEQLAAPVIDGELTGHNRRAAAMAIVDDFEPPMRFIISSAICSTVAGTAVSARLRGALLAHV
jgi:hypothetical protein